jgi:hypothetical protein
MLAREMLTADLTPAQEAVREALLGVLPAALAFWGAFWCIRKSCPRIWTC